MEIVDPGKWTWETDVAALSAPNINSVSVSSDILCHVVIVKSEIDCNEGKRIYRLNFNVGFVNHFKWSSELYWVTKNAWCALGFCLTNVTDSYKAPVHISISNISENCTLNYDQDVMLNEIWAVQKFHFVNSSPYPLTFMIRIYEKIPLNHPQQVEDFSETWLSKDYDVILYGDDWEYRSHREVLACRSPVFSAMFRHCMSESTSGRVRIIDIQPNVVKAMIQYMYTGKPVDMDKFPDELLIAANKYQLDELKSLCEDYLCQNINFSNVTERLFATDLYQSKKLRSHCENFIVNNINQVLETAGWKKLEESNQILCSIIKNLANKK